jgi:tRNA pseudouridine38-40 synthase
MRYFLEVSYKGTNFNGFQIQNTGKTIQGEIQNALLKLFKDPIILTGSSRTDAGVHALQNYFHFDIEGAFPMEKVYNLNSMISPDIVIKRRVEVGAEAHARFDANTREYKYYIHQSKNPFIQDTSYYYPYTLDWDKLNAATALVLGRHDFSSFSKKNTQVNNHFCEIFKAKWYWENEQIVFNIRGNRFLRGMVRALVATMLKVGRGFFSLDEFKSILAAHDCSSADFSAPGKGLFLVEVAYPLEVITPS